MSKRLALSIVLRRGLRLSPRPINRGETNRARDGSREDDLRERVFVQVPYGTYEACDYKHDHEQHREPFHEGPEDGLIPCARNKSASESSACRWRLRKRWTLKLLGG